MLIPRFIQMPPLNEDTSGNRR